MKQYNRTLAIIFALSMLIAGCSNATETSVSMVHGKGQLTESSSDTESSDSLSSSELPDSSESPASSESSASSPASSEPPASSGLSASSSSLPSDEASSPFAFSSKEVKAGDMTILSAKGRSAAGLSVKADFSGSFKFFDKDGAAVALMGVSRSTKPGEYHVTVFSDGNELEKLTLTVLDGGFKSQSFTIDQGTADSTINNNTARDEYNKMLAEVTSTATADSDYPDFKGFIMPIKQQSFKISSSYGYTRIVNGKVTSRHEGVDFPAPAGTPVTASGAGRVVYSGFVQMTGNTVVIEHGMGLKTWYCHMSELDCSEGDLLEIGDPVGKVGTTGYSTGNHLHFGMSVNDIYTNPWQYISYPG